MSAVLSPDSTLALAEREARSYESLPGLVTRSTSLKLCRAYFFRTTGTTLR
jgi:hypothetical protein